MKAIDWTQTMDSYALYYEAPRRGEETRRTVQQLAQSIRKGLRRVMPLMPYLGKRAKR